MEHKELEGFKTFAERYGYTVRTVFNKAEIYIDGIPCQCWIDEEGYHVSAGDTERIRKTWKKASAIIIKYIMGEYII